MGAAANRNQAGISIESQISTAQLTESKRFGGTAESNIHCPPQPKRFRGCTHRYFKYCRYNRSNTERYNTESRPHIFGICTKSEFAESAISSGAPGSTISTGSTGGV